MFARIGTIGGYLIFLFDPWLVLMESMWQKGGKRVYLLYYRTMEESCGCDIMYNSSHVIVYVNSTPEYWTVHNLWDYMGFVAPALNAIYSFSPNIAGMFSCLGVLMWIKNVLTHSIIFDEWRNVFSNFTVPPLILFHILVTNYTLETLVNHLRYQKHHHVLDMSCHSSLPC